MYWQAENGVKEVVAFLESYDITKDDWDNVMELCKLPGTPNVLSQIPPKVMHTWNESICVKYYVDLVIEFPFSYH